MAGNKYDKNIDVKMIYEDLLGSLTQSWTIYLDLLFHIAELLSEF